MEIPLGWKHFTHPSVYSDIKQKDAANPLEKLESEHGLASYICLINNLNDQLIITNPFRWISVMIYVPALCFLPIERIQVAVFPSYFIR